MRLRRTPVAIAFGCFLVAGCQVISPPPPPPPTVSTGAFTPLGLSAAYVSGDVVSGRRARAAKMRAAGIRPLSPAAAPAYIAALDSELRRQTAGIGVDVIRLADGILIRIPAALTFDSGSAIVKPQFDSTLLEIARTVKTNKQA
jgi:outer membrane protein OmpA-like peptidoglycan-associated protein